MVLIYLEGSTPSVRQSNGLFIHVKSIRIHPSEPVTFVQGLTQRVPNVHGVWNILGSRCPSEPAAFVQRLPNVFQTPTLGSRGSNVAGSLELSCLGVALYRNGHAHIHKTILECKKKKVTLNASHIKTNIA